MGIMHVKYPFPTESGKEITKEQKELGEQMYHEVEKWCEQSAQDDYEVSNIMWAKGIRVTFKDPVDTKRLREFMK